MRIKKGYEGIVVAVAMLVVAMVLVGAAKTDLRLRRGAEVDREFDHVAYVQGSASVAEVVARCRQLLQDR